ncbi:hypothetical protein AAEX28_02325 [Lentisphaerota bacterium WC36G]|nr:hypothetical protein LJT99_05210 [Lentisphaerae bacterium WC36]
MAKSYFTRKKIIISIVMLLIFLTLMFIKTKNLIIPYICSESDESKTFTYCYLQSKMKTMALFEQLIILSNGDGADKDYGVVVDRLDVAGRLLKAAPKNKIFLANYWTRYF